jgi:hypothetical protein
MAPHAARTGRTNDQVSRRDLIPLERAICGALTGIGSILRCFAPISSRASAQEGGRAEEGFLPDWCGDVERAGCENPLCWLWSYDCKGHSEQYVDVMMPLLLVDDSNAMHDISP